MFEIVCYSYGALLTLILMKKITSEFCLVVSREVLRENWNLDSLMEVMEREIEARERSVAETNSSNRRSLFESSHSTDYGFPILLLQ